MGKKWGGRRARSNVLGNLRKLETDVPGCMDALEREWRGMRSVDHASLATDVPTLISAPLDASHQEEMLRRTKSSMSAVRTTARTTTQKMQQASRINGVVVLDPHGRVVTSTTRVAESPRRIAKNSLSSGGGSDESTLPSFLSVGESVRSRSDVEIVASDALFLISKDGIEEAPLIRPLDDTETSMQAVVQGNRETRKRLHYKGQLRSLTKNLTTTTAVERSKEMFSYIMENGKTVSAGAGAGAGAGNSIQDDEEGASAQKKCPGFVEGLKKKLLACTSRLCVDEAVVDHEGLVISVHSGRCEDAEPMRRHASDVSSLTGDTHHRFVSRNWLRDAERGLTWV